MKAALARACRAHYSRSFSRRGELLALHCAAMAPTLMESELFGHERGTFMNALERHLGCFEQADGGTLFSTRSPVWRRRFGQSSCESWKKDRCVGSEATASIPVAVRVVAATNRLPAGAVKGKLSQDLFYRLNLFHLALPPLRERADDIPLLARYFLSLSAKNISGRSCPGLLTLRQRCLPIRGPGMCVSYATEWNGWRCWLPGRI